MTSVAVDVLSVMSSDMRPRMGERDIYLKVNQIREKRHQVCTFVMVSRTLFELSNQLILEKSSFAPMFGLSSIGKMLVGKEPLTASAENHLKRHGYETVPISFDGSCGSLFHNEIKDFKTDESPVNADGCVNAIEVPLSHQEVKNPSSLPKKKQRAGMIIAANSSSSVVKLHEAFADSDLSSAVDEPVVNKEKNLSIAEYIVEKPSISLVDIAPPPHSDALHLSATERNVIGFVYQQSKTSKSSMSIDDLATGINVSYEDVVSTVTALSHKNYLSLTGGVVSMSSEHQAEVGWGDAQQAATPYLHLYGLSVIPQLIIRYIAKLRKLGGRCRASVPQLSKHLSLCKVLSGTNKEVESKVRQHLAILVEHGVISLISGMYQLNSQALMLLGGNKISNVILSKILRHDYLSKWWDVLKLHLDSKDIKHEGFSFVDAPAVDLNVTVEAASLNEGNNDLQATEVISMSENPGVESPSTDVVTFGDAVTYLKSLAEKVGVPHLVVGCVEKCEILNLIARAFAYDQPETESTLLAIKEDLLRVSKESDPVKLRILYAAGKFSIARKSEKLALLSTMAAAFSFDNDLVSNVLNSISEDIQKL